MKRWFVSLMAVAVALSACSKKPSAPAENEKPSIKESVKAMTAMSKAMGEMAKAATNGAPAGVVDFREMKALLPKELPGGLKGELKGQKSGAMGMTMVEAEGRYEAENGETSLTIKMSDVGGMGPFGIMAHAAWTTMEIDNETDDGYEKTTKLDGFKAMEKFNTKEKSGEIQVFVDNRFIVEVRGDGVTADQLKAAVHAVDLKKLTALKPQPPSTP